MRMIALTVFAALLLATSVVEAKPKWSELESYSFDQYLKDFGKPYEHGTDEYMYRRDLFGDRLLSVRNHNADVTKTYKRGVNMFSDMSAAEWKSYNKNKKSPFRQAPTQVYTGEDSVPIPDEVDYRTWTSPRVLTAVKHQGSCGNCWAFSATETMEAHYALLTGKLPVLSPQMITSCTPTVYGCNGGDATSAWQWVQTTDHGLTEEWCYPFTDFFFNFTDPNAATSKCYNVSSKYPNKTPYSWFAELTRVGIAGTGLVKQNASAALSFLAHRGPLSIAVAAGNWQDYETGVFQNSAASGQDNEWEVDHAVQMVGYGHDAVLGLDYWIVRNSWSTQWGEDGFIRLDRPAEEPCNTMADQGTVCGTSGCLSDLQFPIIKAMASTPF
jgi:hypothetical protein